VCIFQDPIETGNFEMTFSPRLLTFCLLSCSLLFLEFRIVEAQTLSLRFLCDDNEILTLFSGSGGEQDWVGLYRESLLTNLPLIPETNVMEEWYFICGSTDDCVNWPLRGAIRFSMDALQPGIEYRVVMANGEALPTLATSEVFRLEDGCGQLGPPVAPPGPPVAPPGPPDTESPTWSPTAFPTAPPALSQEEILAAVRDCRDDLRRLIEQNRELIGQLLRLVFHDCVGGCDGCVDLSNPDNGGVDIPIAVLAQVVAEYEPLGLTRADVWMLSALVATEVALPNNFQGVINFPLRWYGRRTCEEINNGNCGLDFNGRQASCGPTGGPHRELCHGVAGTQTIQEFFEQEFGFNDREIVAIMGAHSVGRMRRFNVGNEGQWDLTVNTLDNGYFLELTDAAPDFQLTFMDNSALPVADTFQWEGVTDTGTRITMLNSDLALVRDLDEAESVQCEWSGPNSCSTTTPFAGHVANYVTNTELFLRDFRDVLNLLIDHGNVKSGDCDEEICQFL